MTEYQEDIRDALRRMYGLDFTYLRTEYVKVEFGGKMWGGGVEVFAVHQHAQAVLAYAWGIEEADAVFYVSYLAIPPVSSTVQAVRAAVSEGYV